MNNKLLPMIFVFSLLFSLFIPYPLFAAPNAPSDVKIKVDDQFVSNSEVVKVDPEQDNGIVVLVNHPGGDISAYDYLWNQLDADAASQDFTQNENALNGETSIFFKGSEFNQGEVSDYNTPWYFHVKSLPIGGGDSSAESRFGPYYFDMKAPVIQISLKEKEGQDPVAGTADSTTVVLSVNSPPNSDLAKVYLSNTANRPQTATDTIAEGTVFPYDLSEFTTEPVNKTATVYVWFEDNVGNIAQDTLTLTINAGKKMLPADDTTLGTGATMNFEISGAGAEAYTWTIVNADDVNQASTSATVSGTTKAAVVTGVSEGTIKVKAVTAGEDPYYSGIITIVLGYTLGDVNDDGEITAKDAVDAFWLSLKDTWTAAEIAKADYNKDGEITSKDAVDIFWKSLE